MMNRNKIDALDRHAGMRLKLRRTTSGVTLEDLAAHLKVQWQVVQKIERGETRLSPSRMWALAGYLKVTPNYFFEGLDDARVPDDEATLADLDPRELTKESLELLRLFGAMPVVKQRSLMDVAKAMGGAGG